MSTLTLMAVGIVAAAIVGTALGLLTWPSPTDSVAHRWFRDRMLRIPRHQNAAAAKWLRCELPEADGKYTPVEWKVAHREIGVSEKRLQAAWFSKQLWVSYEGTKDNDPAH